MTDVEKCLITKDTICKRSTFSCAYPWMLYLSALGHGFSSLNKDVILSHLQLSRIDSLIYFILEDLERNIDVSAVVLKYLLGLSICCGGEECVDPSQFLRQVEMEIENILHFFNIFINLQTTTRRFVECCELVFVCLLSTFHVMEMILQEKRIVKTELSTNDLHELQITVSKFILLPGFADLNRKHAVNYTQRKLKTLGLNTQFPQTEALLQNLLSELELTTDCQELLMETWIDKRSNEENSEQCEALWESSISRRGMQLKTSNSSGHANQQGEALAVTECTDDAILLSDDVLRCNEINVPISTSVDSKSTVEDSNEAFGHYNNDKSLEMKSSDKKWTTVVSDTILSTKFNVDF